MPTPRFVFCLTLAVFAVAATAQPRTELPVELLPGGGMQVEVQVGGRSERFLVDTGAAMMTINSSLYRRLSATGQLTEAREVGARMADGRVRLFKVYAMTGLSVGEGCNAESVEVIVVPGDGRNLLGMNVLSRHAPLTLAVDPPSLGLGAC